MKLKIILVLSIAALFTLVVFSDDFLSTQNTYTNTDTMSVSGERWLEDIKKLPLQKRIGQLMIFGFATTTPDAHILWLIKEYGVGGVNLLKRNVRDAEQIRNLAKALQAHMMEAGLPPMFIAVDQEGGTVVRFPFLSELTAEKDIKSELEAFRIAQKRGMELRNLGITMNFAPVLDYVPDAEAYLYDRTFATTTTVAANLGVAMANGYWSVGIIPVFKHFPGYGTITDDPHKKETADGTIFITESLEPFRLALEKLPRIPLMTAHVVYGGIDTLPATRSQKFLTSILRNEWGYDGVIITDDIEMQAARGKEKLSVEDIAISSFKAGADMIISTYTTALHEKIIEAVEGAVISGRLSENRLNQSVLRVWRLKLSI